MKYHLALIALFTAFCLPESTHAQSINLGGSTTRAVVVGISDYKDVGIPDLRFADRDAQAFANFLRSPAGGSLNNYHLQVLTNEKANAGNIIAALTWLVEDSKPGDRTIISFSGHGDVEQVTKSQWGYLLAHDAPPKVYPAGGTVPLPYLQDIIATLSEAGVQVFIVSDACHAGKLAGSSRSGSKATTSALAQQFSNEVKILSCQPDEFSLEGDQWGGGRGCFSFHLLNALIGAADANADGAVSLLETGRYLEDKVPTDAAPQSQIPMTIGSRGTVLANVDAPTLTAFREAKQTPPALSPGSMRGMEDALLANTDSTLRELYHRFEAALENGNLLDSSGNSANDLYLRIIHEPEMSKLHGAMTRNLAAALQNQAQVVINQMLATDPQIVDDAFSPVSRYDHLPAYLARAAELLGEKHYMYRFLKAREYYFRSKTLRAENHPSIPADSLLHRQLACLDTALSFDSMAAYVYFEKGCLQYWGMQRMEQMPELCRTNFEKAIALSPEWVLSVYFLGRITYYWLNDTVKGNELLQKAIELDSTFLPSYLLIAGESTNKQYNFWLGEYVRRMRDYERQNPGRVPVTYFNNLGNTLWRLGRNEEAKAALLKGVEISKGKYLYLYGNLGGVYCDLGQYEEAEKAAIKLIELRPLNYEGYNQLAQYRLYFLKKKLETVSGLYRRGIQLGDDESNNHLAFFYQQQGQLDSALLVAREWLNKDTTNPQALLRLGQTLSMQGNERTAREAFQKLLEIKASWVLYPAFYFQLIARLQTEPKDGTFQTFIETERLKSDDLPGFCFWTACALASCDRRDTALDWLEKALQAGWKPGPANWIYPTLFNPDLDAIRDTGRFKKMVKKYLPEQARIMNIK